MLLTNASAMTALRTLRVNDRSVDQVQQRIATGLKVASAKDNAAFFLVANTQRSDIVQLRGTRENLNFALGAITTAQAAQPVLSKIIDNIAAAITMLETGAAEQEIGLTIRNQIDMARNIIQSTDFNGINLLDQRQIESFQSGLIRDDGSLGFPLINVQAAGFGFRESSVNSATLPFPGAVLDYNSGGAGTLNGTLVPTQAGVNTGGPFTEKTFGIAFETGSDINSLQVLYEQGGGIRGMNISIENGNLQFGAYNQPMDGGSGNWGYFEVEAALEANTRYTAQLVLDGDPAYGGELRTYLDGMLIQTVSGVGILYNHGDPGAIGRINGSAVINGVGVSYSAATAFQGSIDKVVQYNTVYDAAAFDQVTGYLAEGWLPEGGIQYYLGNPARVESATLIELLEAMDPDGQDGFSTAGALEVLDAARQKLNRGFAEIGFAEKRVRRQQEYLDGLILSMEEGVASLVEADLAEESARMQSFEVRQQLALLSLDISNQRPSVLLQLF
ncbi:MAG: flagellin [Parvularcula sp.]|jgi:flagellin-like hook-associated protein FlgL|nr:flagellin [Parvularcula sp.]